MGATEQMISLLRKAVPQLAEDGFASIPEMPQHCCSLSLREEEGYIHLFTIPVDGKDVYVYLKTNPNT